MRRKYHMPDGSEINDGKNLLGILRNSKKHNENECVICDKIIGNDKQYIIMNDLSPYYWHISCLLNESPDFLIIHKTKKESTLWGKILHLYTQHLNKLIPITLLTDCEGKN